MRRELVAALLLATLLSACAGKPSPPPATSSPPPEVRVESVAEGLDTPWALAFAPDGRIFVTERPGRVRVIDNGTLDPVPWAAPDTHQQSESGLMGIALHPDFPDPPHVYLYLTVEVNDATENRIVRYREEGGRGVHDADILTGIPAAPIHDGGRLKFGPDGKLWATTGDASVPARSQEDVSPSGKVLRLNPDGSIPDDNPNPTQPWWTKGHRNVQGIDWHPKTGDAYVTEHGPQTDDEVNILKQGRNYGWPLTGRLNNPAFEDPIRVYAPSTIAPAGATFFTDPSGQNPDWDGAFFFVTLKDRDMRVLHLDPDDPTSVLREDILYDDVYGRMRDIVQGPDGNLYFTTSNQDGRGSPKSGDDHVYRILVR